MKYLKDRSKFLKINEIKVNDEDFGEDKKDHVKYEHGCVMLKVERNDQWNQILESIADEDVYESEEEPGKYGIERECHITVLFGLLDNDINVEEITEVITNREPIKLKMVDISMFENEEFDVLKFGIESEDLIKFNEDLKKFPFENKYPDYVPHATIGYLKKGTAKKYIKSFTEEEFIELEGLTDIVYSRIEDGEKEKINLKIVQAEEVVEESADIKQFTQDQIKTMLEELDFFVKKIQNLESENSEMSEEELNDKYSDLMINIEEEFGAEAALILNSIASDDDFDDYVYENQNDKSKGFLMNFDKIKAFLKASLENF